MPFGFQTGNAKDSGYNVLWDIQLDIDQGTVYVVESQTPFSLGFVEPFMESGAFARMGRLIGEKNAINKFEFKLISRDEALFPDDYPPADINKISHFIVGGDCDIAVKNPLYHR